LDEPARSPTQQNANAPGWACGLAAKYVFVTVISLARMAENEPSGRALADVPE